LLGGGFECGKRCVEGPVGEDQSVRLFPSLVAQPHCTRTAGPQISSYFRSPPTSPVGYGPRVRAHRFALFLHLPMRGMTGRSWRSEACPREGPNW
jgi:hypothetical protein